MALSLVYITLHLNVAFVPIALFITTDDLKKAKEIESASYRMLVITTFLAWCALSYSTISQAYNWLKDEKIRIKTYCRGHFFCPRSNCDSCIHILSQ